MEMKKLMNNALGMTVGGVTMGVGASVLGSVGSAKGAEGMANMSSSLPAIGTISGGSAVIGTLKKLL
jgi:hypothetical protein